MKNNKIVKMISNYILSKWFSINYNVLYFDNLRGNKKDQEIAQISYQLRKSVYVDEKSWEQTSKDFETDDYDQYSKGIVLVNKKTKEPIGTMRMIFKKSGNQLPVEPYLEHAISSSFGEVSRLSILKNQRNKKIFKFNSSSLILYLCALLIGLQEELQGVIFYSERKLIVSLKKLGFKVTKISDKKITHCGIDRFIYLIDREGVENIYKKPELTNLLQLLNQVLKQQIKIA